MLQNVGQQEPGPLSRLGETPFPILVASHPHGAVITQDRRVPCLPPCPPCLHLRSAAAQHRSPASTSTAM